MHLCTTLVIVPTKSYKLKLFTIQNIIKDYMCVQKDYNRFEGMSSQQTEELKKLKELIVQIHVSVFVSF